MEKKIILMSNSKNHSIQNTLTHFQNEFLDTTYLKPHKRWEISLDQIGLHARFKNYGTSRNNKYPSLLSCTRLYFVYVLNCDLFGPNVNDCKLKLSDFEDYHQFYLNEKMSYTPLMLHRDFSTRTRSLMSLSSEALSSYSGMVTKIDSANNNLLFKQFDYPGSESMLTMRQMRTILFFHENFKTSLQFDNSLFDGKVSIDNEQYFWRYNSDKKEPLKLSLESTALYLKIPNIIKIVCPNVKPFITKEGYSREIALIPINEEDCGKYINRNFVNKETFILEDDVVNNIQIQLTDENDNALRLSDGLPSLIKLHAKEVTMNQFCVHVDSRKTSTFPENQPNSFKTRLPSSLSLRGNRKCAVASATFRNDLEIDEYMDLTFSIEWQDVNENIDFGITLNAIGNDNYYSAFKINTFKVDYKLRNVDEIVDYFSTAVEDWIEVRRSSKGVLSLIYKKDATLKTSKYLSKILGFKTTITSFELTKEENESFVCPVSVEDIPLFSQTMFIFSNTVDLSILGHTYANILKVVPIPGNSREKYVTVEFDTLEYIPLQFSEVQELDFTLRSISGANIKFIRKDFCEVFLNLIFKKF